ncbi:MAG TPA: energy transducer TonB, partial [Terriglobales bacterium]|nr:energy transducer TonB [Terriglobales bacterium]
IKVRVRVSVDSAGNVTAAKFVSSGPSQYFARIAIEAAQKWKFKPPVSNGRAVPSEWALRFDFTRSGTEAFAEQTSAVR